MAEEGKRMNPFSSGLAVLLSADNSRGTNSQKSHLISYQDDISHHSVERTIEHILDLPHKSIHSPSHTLDINFIRSILKNQEKKFQFDQQVNDSPRKRVLIDKTSICGQFKTIREPLLLESVAAFSSARADACVCRGKWMYEAVLETCGVQQLGWATLSCPFTDHKGVGDADDSYAFDGKRVKKWNKEPKSYGQPWAIGDVIGCCIDLDKGEISFYRNGLSLGVAFDGVRVLGQGNGYGYYPSVSLSDGERCYLNFGSHPFVYPVEGFNPVQDPPPSRRFAGYLLQSLVRLLEAEALERSDSAYFHKLRRVKRFAPLKDQFDPVSRAIFSEFFDLIGNTEEQDGNSDLEYITWGPLTSFLMEVFRSREPHDLVTLDRVLDLFLQYPKSGMLFQEVFFALSCSCKVAPLVLTECPYTGSYPYLALAFQLLRRREMLVLWWQSQDFTVSFEGFLSGKVPNRQDLKELMPTVWWPALLEDSGTRRTMALTVRTLSEAISKEWTHVLSMLSQLSFTHECDRLSWRWSASGSFSIKSLYQFLNHRGVLISHPMVWWSLPIPPKIKVFMWLTFKNRILTRVNLQKKGWVGDITCVFCSHQETTKHLFLNCQLVRQILHFLGKNHLTCSNWTNLSEVLSFALTLSPLERTAFLIVFSATCWTVWKHRNEICFNNGQPKSARSLIYLIISLVLYWTGHKHTKAAVQSETRAWLPTEETMEAIPLRVIFPDEEIEEMHRQLCSLVIRFTPPGLPLESFSGSVFRSFMQNLIVRARDMEHRTASGEHPFSTVLLSLYTVILHLLSEGSGSPSDEKLGFLHRGGSRHFPQTLFFRTDLYFSSLPRIGGSVNQLLKSHKFSGKELSEIEWEEGFMESEDFRVTHSSANKPCCCSPSEDDWAQTSRESLRYVGGTTSGASSKAACKVISDRPQSIVAAECSTRGLSDEIEDDKPSSSDASGGGFSYQSLNDLGCGTVTNQTFSEGSSEALREEELLDVMLLLYHMVVAPSFRKAFYYISQQTQSVLLLDDTDKQIREKSCAEQVKRLKEARSVYHEELVDSVRHCSWYRISLFSRWKLRGMYAACMWVVDLLLVLSDLDSVFLYVPEYYVETLVDSFHALRRSEPPFVSSTVFLKQGLSSFVTFCVKHFNDSRILSADVKDLLLQSISVLVQYRDFLVVFENNREAVERMPRSLLSAFDNRSWIPVTNILSRLCKGCGFTSSRSTDSVSSVLFQVLLRETCIHDEELFASFLNRLFNTLSWTMTEFSMSIHEMQDKHNAADLQQRKCSVIFDISCSLARILEFCVGEIPQAFLSVPDMNLRRLIELVVFILNHIISAADTDFFDLSLRRPGEKMNRTMILAPILGIMLNILGSVVSDSESSHTSLSDVISVFCSMDCPATLHFGFQYLLNYNWSNILRGDVAAVKLAQLEELSRYFRSMSESGGDAGHAAGTEDGDDNCCICYNSESDALFEPCHHRSCFGCISRHLLNSQRCFFCNATVTSITRF